MTRPAAPPDELYIRQPGRVLGVLTVVPVHTVLVVDGLTGGHHGAAWFSTYALVLGVLALLAVVTQWRAQIVADRVGVRARVQAFRRTRPLAWSEVHPFGMRGYWSGLRAWTTDGERVHLIVYGYWQGTAEGILDQLERYRREQQRALGLVR